MTKQIIPLQLLEYILKLQAILTGLRAKSGNKSESVQN